MLKFFAHFLLLMIVMAAVALLDQAKAAGTVVGWGQNGYFQATNSSGNPTGIQAIAAGSDGTTTGLGSVGFSLGLPANGTTISSWGNNTYLQLGVPTITNSYFVAVAAGEYHGVALDANGKVYAWGGNISRQTNVPAILSSNVVDIAAGGSGTDSGSLFGTHSLALKNDGTVVAWGKNIFGETNVPVGLSNVVAIAAGGVHSLALRADGTIAAWGSSVGGPFSQTNVPLSATNIVAVAAGSLHCLALRTNGTVLAWGTGSSGQTNVPVSASNVVAIAAGDLHSMALRRDGTIVVWGNNPSGYTFSVPGSAATNVIAIASASRHALALVGDGTPNITLPPRNQAVYPGGKAVFIVMAAGSGTLSYQWKANGITIPGATGPILVLTNVQPANSGSYTVTVRNSFGLDTASAGLTTLDGRVSITQPLPVTNSIGANSNLTLTVSAVGAIPLYYQWWKDGAAIANATNASYTITNAQTSSAGGYFVIVSNLYGAVMSSTDNVGVLYFPPIFTQQPSGITNVPVGGSFTLTSAVIGSSPFSWQWRTNGTPIPGATASNYVVSAAQLSDAATYDVVVTNLAGATNSSAVVVNIGYPPVVTLQPFAVTNNPGDNVAFSCLVTGTPSFTYQWILNGHPLPNQTNLNLTLANVQTVNIGYYALLATNSFGNVASSNAALSLNGFNFLQWAGLVAYYPMDNGTVIDTSGYGNTATNFGATAGPDRFANPAGALVLDGATNYVQCPTGAYFSNTFTIIAWVNPVAYNWYSRILDFGSGAPLNNTDLAFNDHSTGLPYLEAYAGTGQLGFVNSTAVVPLNKWTQVIATCSPTNMSLYFNGSLIISKAVSVSRRSLPTNLNYIGKSNWPGDLLYHGSFDDIRILNRALNANEVAQEYALESQPPPSVIPALTAVFGPGQNLNLNYIGVSGSNYLLQTATNLAPPIQWLPLVTNVAGTNGLWQFIDTNANGSQKFYRIITP